MRDTNLKLVDVGGRGSAFPPILPLAHLSHYYVSEPDVQEAERLKEQLPLQAPWRSVTVMSEAIASSRGSANLYLTTAPGMSSLLEPDRSVTKRYCVAPKFDVTSVTTVPTLPLDEAASRYGFTDAAFLKVDTQGTELDILESGARLVAGSLVSVHTESLFQPFYKGQSVFADVDSHLRRNGFALFSLNRTTVRRSSYHVRRYSKRLVVWAHCLYIREPETLLSAEADTRRRQLSHVLAIALAFQHFDLAREVMSLAARVQLLPESDLQLLSPEVKSWNALATRHMVGRAKRKGVEDDRLMAMVFRDKSQLE